MPKKTAKEKKTANPRKPLTNKHGEIRPLEAKDLKSFRPAKEVMPPEFFEGITTHKNKRGRPRVQFPKRHLTLRLPAALVARIKDEKDYSAKIERVLTAAIKTGKFYI